jgi:hypothetical protein
MAKITCSNNYCVAHNGEKCRYTHIAQLLIDNCKTRKQYEQMLDNLAELCLKLKERLKKEEVL